ncbi:hypothetical protein roselon_00280 [Roseibacterium elongatum DSM 19469]|uniref:Uncharacterized protein n=1 Tax=Roseicyclus elongatus DSM 19469 TaxID=1294273 RepID=W8SJP4_9RHOB|nr:hypothetical protein roselon_00280 [Roseibacterium elongatum DSM 19469]
MCLFRGWPLSPFPFHMAGPGSPCLILRARFCGWIGFA